jgi:MOSC domain-containing protein YiiM
LVESRPMQILLDTLPQVGNVEWIGIRPSRDEPMIALDSVQIYLGKGLEGDRIQQEHLTVIASCLRRELIPASLLRRNIVVSGINLLALKNKIFRVGEAVLEFTGHCHPCSKMESQLGEGGYNAMRGHGGITARVCVAGLVCLRDEVNYPDTE